jgi:hypothetical protein
LKRKASQFNERTVTHCCGGNFCFFQILNLLFFLGGEDLCVLVLLVLVLFLDEYTVLLNFVILERPNNAIWLDSTALAKSCKVSWFGSTKQKVVPVPNLILQIFVGKEMRMS